MMWQTVLNLITQAVASAFGWFGDILDSALGAWDTIFTLFVILILSRFLLGPILGSAFRVGRGSDKAKNDKGDDDG